MSEYPFNRIEDYYETNMIYKALVICSNDTELKNFSVHLENSNHSIATLYDINKMHRVLVMTISDYLIQKQDISKLVNKDEYNLIITGNINSVHYNVIKNDWINKQSIKLLKLY